MARYFEMRNDLYVPARWYLADPRDRTGRSLDWVFGKGQSVQIDGPVRVAFNKHAERGAPIDYRELSIEVVPVVHVRVAHLFAELAPSDVQIVPVEIDGHPDQFCIVNVVRTMKCIDDDACEEVRYYTIEDAKVFADKIGRYKHVYGLRIDKSKVADAKIFRTWGWSPVIIVSEDIKLALERIKTEGVKFTEV